MLVDVAGLQSSEQVVTIADVDAGDVNAAYEFADGSSDTFRGSSVRALLDRAAIPLASITFLEITVSGEIMTLDQADLGDPADPGYPFPSGLRPAIFTSGGDSLGYVEPLRDDNQPNDFAQASRGDPVHLAVHTTGAVVTPQIAASSQQVDAGASVDFSVSIASPTTTFAYVWNFRDGPEVPSSDAAIAHTFAAAGRYLVSVTARGADGSYGMSQFLTITVGEPAPPSPAPTTGAGTAQTPAPTTGPIDSSGDKDDATPSKKPTDSSAQNGKGATSTPRPSEKPTEKPTADATATPTPEPSETPVAVTAESTPVEGVLIDPESVASVTPDTASGVDPATARSSAAGERATLGWASAGVTATAALLVLGILAETGALARLRKRMR